MKFGTNPMTMNFYVFAESKTETRWYTNINIRPPTKGALTLLD